MKTKEQIEQQLLDVESHLEEMHRWSNDAYIAWAKEYEIWGAEASRGELEQAHEAHQMAITEVQTLKWVLDQQ